MKRLGIYLISVILIIVGSIETMRYLSNRKSDNRNETNSLSPIKIPTKGIVIPTITPDIQYRLEVINQINSKRLEKRLNRLEVDEQLCKLAKLIADDMERNYPKKINTSLYSNSNYRSYIDGYSVTIKLEVTVDDVLVNIMKKQSKNAVLDNQTLVDSFTDTITDTSIDVGNKSAMYADLTHSCVAVSKGTLGNKPFAYFIGGVKSH